MRGKKLEEIKIKTNTQIVYYEYQTKTVKRLNCYGEQIGSHITDRELSTMFLIDWLAIYRETENAEYIFITEDQLKRINFRKEK